MTKADVWYQDHDWERQITGMIIYDDNYELETAKFPIIETQEQFDHLYQKAQEYNEDTRQEFLTYTNKYL